MPLVTIFQKGEDAMTAELSQELREFVAKMLSGESRVLSSGEVSVRLVETKGGVMIARVEVEILAHAYPERVAHQDVICTSVRTFLTEKLGHGDIQVWLMLGQLGHSYT